MAGPFRVFPSVSLACLPLELRNAVLASCDLNECEIANALIEQAYYLLYADFSVAIRCSLFVIPKQSVACR